MVHDSPSQDHIDYVSVGTPVSNNYYLGAPRGEIYGLDHTQERFSVWNNAILRSKTDIPGVLKNYFPGYLGILMLAARLLKIRKMLIFC